MKAPNKLYISSKQRPNKEIFYGTCTKVESVDIEKACEWLNHKSCLYIQYSEGGTSFNNEQFMEDFKKAMKL